MPIFQTTAELHDEQLQELLGKISANAQDPKHIYDQIGADWAQRVKLSFKYGISPYGVKWLPLKSRIGQPLRDTGRMSSSPDFEATSEGLRVGLPPYDTKGAKGQDVSIPAVHQFGATIVPVKAKALRFVIFKGTAKAATVVTKRVVIPARPFLPSDKQPLPNTWRKDAIKRVLNGLTATGSQDPTNDL